MLKMKMKKFYPSRKMSRQGSQVSRRDVRVRRKRMKRLQKVKKCHPSRKMIRQPGKHWG